MFKKLNTLRLFFDQPTREFNVREIARLLRISPATASKQLRDFTKKSILKERKERLLLLYKANLENDLYRDLKIFFTIRMMRESGLLQALNAFYLRPTLVLFGSAAFGLDTETSDFDILVISENTKPFSRQLFFEKNLKRKLQIIPVKNINDLRNKHLVNNVLNGITLQGRLQWI